MKLLVAYIATSGGEDAVALGAALARTFEAELEICLVVPPQPEGATPDVIALSEKLDRAAGEWVDNAVAKVPKDVPATGVVFHHPHAAEGLTVRAAETDAQMIVIGGSGGGIVGRHNLGTVVNDMLHSSVIPVALAPSGYAHLGADEVHELSVAIGQRPATTMLFNTALRSGVQAQRPIRLISLVALDDMPTWGQEPDQAAVDHARAHARLALDAAHQQLPSDFPVTSTIAEGRTIEEAVTSLPWHTGDVIMVGSSRLARPGTLFLGTTASKILRTVAVPMVVVPSEGPQKF